MCYTQLFNLLCEKADDVYGGRLPVHVRCLIDECANIGQIPKLEKLVAHAKSKHNTVDAGEINDFFVGDNLTPEQMDQIYSYLENRNIDVVPVLDEAMLNADPALDDIGLDLDLDDDSFMKDAEEEESSEDAEE